ncbi:MAG: hypothetical protein II537_01420 [Bacteroidales bacterium]|nr:hypothetical protein [Bacteroidales bacterium]
MKTFKKILIWLLVLALLGLAAFCYFRFWFVLGEGVKAGELNQVVYKGWVWKTYEGRLIQSGFNSHKTGALQSNEFNFSITDTQVAEKLMLCSGKVVEVRYKEYRGALPWRGMQRYIVYKIESVSEPYHSGVPDFPISPDGDAI